MHPCPERKMRTSCGIARVMPRVVVIMTKIVMLTIIECSLHYKRHYITVLDILHFSSDSIACTVFHWFTSSTCNRLLNVDYFFGQLHGCDDIQHVGRFANLYAIQKVKMVQTSATYEYFDPTFKAVTRSLQ